MPGTATEPQPPAISTGLPHRRPDFESRSPDFKRWVLETEKSEPIERDQEAKDRRDLVRPRPADWKPEHQGRKLRMVLVLKEPTIRKGEFPWYRLELQNVGTVPVEFFDSDSFLKNGELLRYRWHLYVNGEELRLGKRFWGSGVGFAHNPPGWDRLTPEQQAAEIARLEWKAKERQIRKDLRITLAPGEKLLSKPWKHLAEGEWEAMTARGEDPDHPPVSGTFREMYADPSLFEKPGTYQVKFAFSDPPPAPPTEEEFLRDQRFGLTREKAMRVHRRLASKALGIIESNPVSVKVLP